MGQRVGAACTRFDRLWHSRRKYAHFSSIGDVGKAQGLLRDPAAHMPQHALARSPGAAPQRAVAISLTGSVRRGCRPSKHRYGLQHRTAGSSRRVVSTHAKSRMPRSARLVALPALLVILCLGEAPCSWTCDPPPWRHSQLPQPCAAAAAAPPLLHSIPADQLPAFPTQYHPSAGGARASCIADAEYGYGEGSSGCQNCTADGARCEACWEGWGLTKSGECKQCLPKLKVDGSMSRATAVCASCDGDAPDICTA